MYLSRRSRSVLACLLFFAIISVLVITGVTTAWDLRALQLLASVRFPGMTTVMRAASWIGDWEGEVPLIVVVATALWWRGRPTCAWRFVAVIFSAEALMNLIKVIAQRARPDIALRLSGAGWYSYPSGHATLAPVIWGLGLILLAQLVESRAVKIVLWTLAVVISTAIAASRLYLGVHYPTDVLAGLALGVGWVIFWRSYLLAPSACAGPVQPT